MTDERAIHIHEDEWGMRSLHPIAAAGEVADDLREAAAASEANRAPDGVGWTDVHVVRPPDLDYAAAGLTFAAADATLAPIMPRVRRFAATAGAGFDGDDPYGTYEDDAYCYGVDATCFVKLDGDGRLVSRVWFRADTADTGHLDTLRRAIVALDALVPSVVADHWIDAFGPVADPDFFEGYMRALAE